MEHLVNSLIHFLIGKVKPKMHKIKEYTYGCISIILFSLLLLIIYNLDSYPILLSLTGVLVSILAILFAGGCVKQGLREAINEILTTY